MQLQLDKLVESIELAFGEELPFVTGPITEDQRAALQQVFGDAGYQSYLQDQVNRQIVRDYLTNAVVLGFITEADVVALEGKLDSAELRSAMSLHMLMNSIEQADDLLAQGVPEPLQALEPDQKSPPHMHLISS
ncbi:hypothetical protein EY643_04890 [Halioglobus maricola]|uniref:Uncharacterized protein n=1 Tax=Halioglobus maricola TaxID=2601894 RepID=A0A5P9NHM6_9GAMM|nr:hypothetical protein [Halioglobus maricola]QFU75035.1 hypothetical protein EY643_04890 [Halioglobus maricola]